MQATLRTIAFGLLVTGCGSVPLVGGKSKKGSDPAPAATADAVADQDHDPALIKAITTDAVASCHKNGLVWQFSTDTCSQTLKVATWTCDRSGIEAAFASTGFQISEALDDARAAGFVIDECGESDDGHVYAELVKKDAAGSVIVRELEAQR